MDYFNLGCSIVLRSLWLYGGYLIFVRKITYSPFTNNKWSAWLTGILIISAVLTDTHRKFSIN